jgi:ABC-type Fe3+-siderophore transport system, permease component
MFKEKIFGKYLSIFLFLFLAISLLSLSLGHENYALNQLFSSEIVRNIRIPRLIAGVCLAVLLSTSGLLMQNLTQNPIADMSTLGVSSGASLALSLALNLSVSSNPWTLIVYGSLGAGLAFFIVFILTLKDKFDPLKVILVGTSVGLFSSSLASAISYYKKNSQQYFLWIVGSFSGINKQKMLELLIVSIFVVLMVFIFAKQIKILGFGSELATGLGVNVSLTRFIIMILVVLAAGVSVSTVGMFSFVGLIGPHMARRLIGSSSFVRVFILSNIMTIDLVILADFLSRYLFRPYEFPVGSLLMLLGAPFFLYLVARSKEIRS